MDKLEKLEIITQPQANQWMNYRTIRNKLIHEYPTNQDEMIAGIQLAMVYFKEINEVLNNINGYLQKTHKLKFKVWVMTFDFYPYLSIAHCIHCPDH